MDDEREGFGFGLILLPKVIYLCINSVNFLIHFVHLLLLAVALGPVEMMHAVPPTVQQLIEFLLHLEALSQVLAQKPSGLLLDDEAHQIED